MSARGRSGQAAVVDLAAARQRPSGQRSVARRSDGHRLGDHGNRASALMKEAVIHDLRDIAAIRGDVTADDLRDAAARADVSYRQVCRWWRADLATQLAQHTATGTGQNAAAGEVDGRGNLPRYLYRYAEPTKFQFTRDEIAFIGRHHTAKDGFAALAELPGSRIRHLSRSTLYAAWNNVSPAIRVGIKYGDATQRASEATYPLTGRDQLNETWSIDEYDLKIRADYHGVAVEPKVLIVRERRSGAPLAYTLMPRSATGTDTGVVLAAAAIGFTCTHPRHPDRDLRVAGVPRMLVSDQGGAFLGETGASAARRLGIGLNPVASHRPQSNGDHEVMHQSLLAHFAAGPGSRRGWADRTGQRLDHGTLPWDAVAAEVADWWMTQLNTPYTSGDRKGRTRLEVYADDVAADNTYTGPALTPADEAALAVTVAERSYDNTRGVAYDNRYWLSPELAAAARDGERITLKQLLDPGVVYAFDRHGRFIAILTDRAEVDLDDVHGLHADRVARQRFVEGSVAEARAAAARDDAVDAAAVWAEVADGLAADHSDPHDATPDTRTATAPAPATDGSTVGGVDDLDDDHPRDHLDVVRPTRRRRRAPLVENRDIVDDTDADNVATFFHSNRPQPQHDHQRDHQQQQHRQHVDEDDDEKNAKNRDDKNDNGGDDDAR
jgi:transposase InsO family protein